MLKPCFYHENAAFGSGAVHSPKRQMALGSNKKEVFEMKISVIATALVLGGAAVSTAQAMPSPAPVDTAKASQIVHVDYACGRGWHLTPWGHCRPNRYGPPP